MKYKINTLLLFFIFIFIFNIVHAKDLMEPTSYSKDLYQEEILDGNYSNNVTHPDEFLGFGIGERVAAPWQITSALKQWSTQSDRIKIIEYAKSHEGRPLHAVFISSADNINNFNRFRINIVHIPTRSPWRLTTLMPTTYFPGPCDVQTITR